MDDYLYKFTEKVIIATRAGNIERENILKELNDLLSDKPENASEVWIGYLEFLIAIVKGENTEELFKKIDPNLREMFGKVIQKFKGNDIEDKLKEITRKTILATMNEKDQVPDINNELQDILNSKPDNGSQSVSIYIEFLMEILKGNDVNGIITNIDPGLLKIYNQEMEDICKPNMMNFFINLTEKAFKSQESENVKKEITSMLMEMLSGNNPPPLDIKNYLNLLLAVVNDQYKEEMKKGIAAELIEIFDKQNPSN